MPDKKAPSIPLTGVKSSQVESIGYDAASKTMAVKFARGTNVYHYHDVSPDQFHALRDAESIGSHVNKHFVRTKHAFTKIPVQPHA